MSHTYHLLCKECKTLLDLGKIANTSEAGAPQPWSFTGWRDLATGSRVEGAQLGKAIERFLIIHRNHRLQTVSEAYLAERASDVYQTIDTLEELMNTEPNPAPDDSADADEVRRREQ